MSGATSAKLRAAVCAAFVVIGLTIAFALRGLRFDDPYITYRFAENLANGRGFVFNPGDPHPALITTAPLYALYLSLPALVGIPVPTASYWTGALALICAAICLLVLVERRAGLWAGALAGMVLLLFPLAWLTIGFETPAFLAIALLAMVCLDQGHPLLAGVLGGLGMGLRGDGAIVVGVLMAAAVTVRYTGSVRRTRRGAFLLGGALVAYAPLAGWLTWQFGGPLPATLQTKTAQALSGLTGFYPGTTFPQGAGLLFQALVDQGGAFLVVVFAAGLGLVAWAQRRSQLGLAILPVVWAALHFLGYTVIGVAPYVWYYVPIIPGLAVLAGLGLDWVRARIGTANPRMALLLTLPLAAAIALALLIGDVLIARALVYPVPAPSEVRSKVLPEPKVDAYEQTGRWIAANTPATATLGVTELGVMSYFAQRTTIDFLGLTQPQHLADIRHGDFTAALLREQPDFLALTAINAIYIADPQKEAWFQWMYTRTAVISDTRFWGSPMTIWRRVHARLEAPVGIDAAPRALGEDWQVTEMAVDRRLVGLGRPTLLRLKLKAGAPVGNRTLRVQAVAPGQNEGLPVVSQLVRTGQWRPGEEAWLDFPMYADSISYAGGYIVSARWLEGGPEAQAGWLKTISADAPAPIAAHPLSSGIAAGLAGAMPAQCANAPVQLPLVWRGGLLGNIEYHVFAQVRDKAGATVAQSDGVPQHNGRPYPAPLWEPGEWIADTRTATADKPPAPGVYDVVVGLYNPDGGARLPVDPANAQTADGGVIVGQVELKDCN